MKCGNLFFDSEIDRINVSWEDGSYGDGFHAGSVVFAYIPATEQWEHYRIEYNDSNDEWYFIGYGAIPVGTKISTGN